MHVAGLGKPQREGAGAGEQVGHALGFFQMPGHQVAHHLFGRLACLHEAARRRVDDHPAELELRRLLLDQDLAVEGQPRDARFRPHRLDDPQPVGFASLNGASAARSSPGAASSTERRNGSLPTATAVASRLSAGSAWLIRSEATTQVST
jgi:hypothetical protein